jgi:hemerythrin
MIQFTDDFIIGIEQIDGEHRHLFELFSKGMELLQNEYVGDRYDDVKTIIYEMQSYAEEHFEHEEAYMQEICDPELPRQRIQHRAFRDRVRSWEFVNIEEEDEQQRVLEELISFMYRWFYRHILSSDMMIGKLPPLEEWMLKENPCEFTEEYLTGIELVDGEHKELFRIIDEVNHLVRLGVDKESLDGIFSVLGDLTNYTKEHFADEEEYMEAIGYDGIDAQKRAHRAFIEKLESMKPSDIIGNPQANMESLVEFLMQWLINHILYTDKKIPVKEV